MTLKKFLIFVFFLIILSLSAYAQAFTITLTPIKNRISVNEMASFNFTIKNELKSEKEYEITTISAPTWEVCTEPLQRPIRFKVIQLSSKNLVLFLNPANVERTGIHSVGIKVNDVITGVSKTTLVNIDVYSVERALFPGSAYKPSVVANIKMPTDIDPRKKIPINLNLYNQNPLNLSSLQLQIQSNTINDVREIDLKPNEKKIITIDEIIDPLTSPQKDNLIFTILKDDIAIVGPLVQSVEVKGYTELEEKKVTKEFLKTIKEMEFVSNNPSYTGNVKIETTFWKSLITSTKPKAKLLREGGKRYFIWEVNLVNNKMAIKVSENLRPLFITILAVVAVFSLYYLNRSPLVAKKCATNVAIKEGGIGEFKVLINIKNRSNIPIKDIEISDKIPNIADIEKELYVGTLKPTTILKHSKKGSLIKWVIDDLSASEERIISYKVKPVLPIIGEFTLPSALIKFKVGNKEKKINSSHCKINLPKSL